MARLSRLLFLTAMLVAMAGAPAMAAVPLQAPGTAPEGAVFAAGADGTLVLATREARTPYSTQAVRVTMVPPNGFPAPTVRLALPSRRFAAGLSVAVDAKGTATVAWTQYGPPRPHADRFIYVRAVRCHNGGCGPARTLARTGYDAQPAASFDGSGRSVVLWRGGVSTTPDLQWARGDDDGFSAPSVIERPGLQPALIDLPNGSVLAAWLNTRGDGPGVRTAILPRRGHRARLGQALGEAGVPLLARAGGRVAITVGVGDTTDRLGDPLFGRLQARLGVPTGGGVRFGAAQMLALRAREATIAGNRTGRAVVAFENAPSPATAADNYVTRFQPLAATLQPGASAYAAPQALAALPVAGSRYGLLSAGVGRDGVSRIGIVGRRLTVEEGDRDGPSLLASISADGQLTATGSSAADARQPVLVAAEASALRRTDGSWLLERAAGG